MARSAPAARPVPVARSAPAARPAPREPREDRSRYARRQESNLPVILLGVSVGLLLFLVAAVIFAGPWFRHPHNQNVYFDAKELWDQRDRQGALKRLEDADPLKDEKYWEKCQELKAELTRLMAAQDEILESQGEVFKEYTALESWCVHHASDVAGQVQRLREFIAKHPQSTYALHARQRLGGLLPGGADRPTGGGTTAPADLLRDLGERFEIAKRSAASLRAKDRFGEAQDALWEFLDAETRAKLSARGVDVQSWQAKVEDEVRKITTAANNRYAELDRRAQELADGGDVGRANEIYRDIALRFGIDKFIRLAQRRKEELAKRD
jgi:hypothetical protein